MIFGLCFVPCGCEGRGHNTTDGGEEGVLSELTRPTVETMLKKTPGGVGADKLREFLDDPMHDNDVRQDEKERPTTLEHVKLLRNRLEKSRKDDLKQLHNDVRGLKDDMKKMLQFVQELHNVERPLPQP